MTDKRYGQLFLGMIELVFVLINTAAFAFVWYTFYYDKMYTEPFWYKGNLAVIAVFLILYVAFSRLYGTFDLKTSRVSELIYANLIALVMTVVIMYAILWLLIRHLPNILPLLLLLVICFAVSIPWSWLGIRFVKKHFRATRIIILYDNEDALTNGRHIIKQMGWRFKLIGEMAVTHEVRTAILAIKKHRPDAVMMCGVHSSPRNTILKYCIEKNIPAYVRPNIGDFLINSAKDIQMASLPVMYCRRSSGGLVYLFIKRFFDILLGLLGFIVFSPFMLVAAIAIKAYDKGPILYSQVRLTKDRKPFKVYKFRSMRVDAEKDGVARLASANDSRITPVGQIIRRFRIDEMPQIFCILKGDMSLVGPRPERPEIAADYEKEMPEFGLRLQVKAGLTGYAQVYGKYNTEPYDKLQMDLMYISRQGLATDLKIIFATIKILFMPESTEGVSEGQVTAKKKK